MIPLPHRSLTESEADTTSKMKSFGGGKKPFVKKRTPDSGGRQHGAISKGPKSKAKKNTSIKYQIRSLERLLRLVRYLGPEMIFRDSASKFSWASGFVHDETTSFISN